MHQHTADQATVSTREFALEVAYNVRHLGGYRTGRGFTSLHVFRGGSLELLTVAGAETLATRVRTVVDLRSALERETNPTPDLRPWGIQVRAAPVFERDASPVGLALDRDYSPVQRYMLCLEQGGPAYRTVCEIIAESGHGVLFHCSAGKDRAGVAAALMLQLAGVGDEDIVDDYKLSERFLQPLLPQWFSRLEARGIDREVAQRALSAPPEDMEATLLFVRRQWGSAEGYLRSFGTAAEVVAAARERLLRPAPPEGSLVS